jgi:hypothetical protein
MVKRGFSKLLLACGIPSPQNQSAVSCPLLATFGVAKVQSQAWMVMLRMLQMTEWWVCI